MFMEAHVGGTRETDFSYLIQIYAIGLVGAVGIELATALKARKLLIPRGVQNLKTP